MTEQCYLSVVGGSQKLFNEFISSDSSLKKALINNPVYSLAFTESGPAIMCDTSIDTGYLYRESDTEILPLCRVACTASNVAIAPVYEGSSEEFNELLSAWKEYVKKNYFGL